MDARQTIEMRAGVSVVDDRSRRWFRTSASESGCRSLQIHPSSPVSAPDRLVSVTATLPVCPSLRNGRVHRECPMQYRCR